VHKEPVTDNASGWSMLERTVQWAGEVTDNPNLSVRELQPSLCFLLLWSMFEGANPKVKITSKNLVILCENETFDLIRTMDIYDFFRKIYFKEGVESVRFKKLKLCNDEAWVRDIFCNPDPKFELKLKAVFLVIYRFRNNIAHGAKTQVRLSIYWRELVKINEFLKSYLETKLKTN